MKATGIIRRIDDLGRVVIPKEIRKRFKIKEGDALEIYTSGSGVTFIPYHAKKNLKSKFLVLLLIMNLMNKTTSNFRKQFPNSKKLKRSQSKCGQPHFLFIFFC